MQSALLIDKYIGKMVHVYGAKVISYCCILGCTQIFFRFLAMSFFSAEIIVFTRYVLLIKGRQLSEHGDVVRL